jgi:class 3 adenylate cyclase/predicted ATPase
MDFVAVVDQAIALLRQRGRVTYRTLQLQFTLDDEQLAALKDELLYSQPHVADDAGRGCIWTGSADTPPASLEAALPHPVPPPAVPSLPEAERRQLTVLFCDLVDSTPLASQLDPEDLREVVRAYQDTCAKVIARFDGHIAQYLGDGLLVYFGYPLAHEDDAQRAVRTGLGMIEALGQLNTRLAQERGVHLAVRLGVHTGLVVVGDMGGGTRQEQLALGETPNIAARLQGLAAPNTLVISAATLQLLGGFFACQSLGTRPVKGIAQPLEVYQVLYESTARSRLEAVGSTDLTPLVGREQEVQLLLERWVQVKEGVGQVVLLSGEAGIGKSRLVQVLKEQVATEPQAWLTPCQCSPYHQHSALYPMIELLERVVLQFDRDETLQQKLSKLEGHLVQYGLPLAEAMPLHTALLSLPLPADYAPLTVSPEQQKQKTMQALLTTLLRIAAQQPVLFVMEDLHWVDPSTLAFLSLLVDQGPTARILTLLTYRPDFSPPWMGRSHLTQVMVNRLPQRQAVEVIRQVARGKALPSEVVEQIVAKTDGVPLFVEELTKMVLESSLLQEREVSYALTGPLPPLAIPATLHDSLMARLDRLAMVKGLAQLGATLGREFAYDLLQAVSLLEEETLQRGLHQLVEAELLYQRGLPPTATYRFKHVLIQDAAYQSLLRSTRQQYHQRIAQALESRFPDIVETQPALLAHHYTEAGAMAQALPYWRRAGQDAGERSAHLEAIAHVSKGLEVLQTLPNSPERVQHELALHLALGASLTATEGYGAPEVERAYTRARTLCQEMGDTPQLIPVLFGLWRFYVQRGQLQTARELGEQCLTLAQRGYEPVHLLRAHNTLGVTLFYLGELPQARTHLEQGDSLGEPQTPRAHSFVQDPVVAYRTYVALVLWLLGYPDQALQRSHDALNLAQELAHPHSLAFTLDLAAWLHQLRREEPVALERAEAAVTLATAQGFALWVAAGTIWRGWALAEQGQREEGITLMHQGLEAWRATGAEVWQPHVLALLAEAYGKSGQAEAGFRVLAEAVAVVEKTGEHLSDAELARLQGELLLQSGVQGLASSVSSAHITFPIPHAEEAEACFRAALDIARRQQAKSLELRAALSLSRLWQQQGKRAEAYELLAPIYGWFTEGLDTADLQEAKALLEDLEG